MRPSLTSPSRPSLFLAAVLVLLSASRSTCATPAAGQIECVRTRSWELATRADCGDNGSLHYCFGTLSTFFNSADLQSCFVNAGCTPDEAQIEATWVLRTCGTDMTLQSDLRRRQAGSEPDAKPAARAEPTTTAAPKTTKGSDGDAKTTTTPAKETPTPTTTPTPSPSPSAESDQGPSSSNPDVVVVTETTTGDTSLGTYSSTSTPLVCFTTTLVTQTVCPTQSTGAAAGASLSCYPTEVPVQTCAAGLLCMTDNSGNASCMRPVNDFGTSGTIVALLFAIAIAGASASMIFFACRERSVQRRLRAQAEAAAIARDAKRAQQGKRPSVGVRSVSGQSAASGDRVPLMQAGAPMGTVVQQVAGPDPFADQYRVR